MCSVCLYSTKALYQGTSEFVDCCLIVLSSAIGSRWQLSSYIVIGVTVDSFKGSMHSGNNLISHHVCVNNAYGLCKCCLRVSERLCCYAGGRVVLNRV